MKKLLLLALLPVASLSYGQITISATDMPVPTGSYSIQDMTNPGMPTSPIPGTNIMWYYGDINGTDYTEDYATETDTFFTNVGVDVNYFTYKSMVGGAAGFAYDVYSELDFTTTDVTEKGRFIDFQGYDLSFVTGNTGDSLTIPAQKARPVQTVQTMKFPLTMSTSWHSVSRQVTDFTLTLSPLYDHTPSQHVYYIHRDDTVAGWGKMRVYTTSGASVWYDVLMDKISYYTVDSFYMGGVAAPDVILSSFGITQGQHTDSTDRYEFYRKGSYNYLAQFNYYEDNTYTNLGDAYYNTDNLTPSGVDAVNNAAYSTVLYPNPVTGAELNFKVMGGNAHIAKYIITDVAGRVVVNAAGDNTATLHVNTGDMATGTYILNVFNDKNERIAQEQFNVTK